MARQEVVLMPNGDAINARLLPAKEAQNWDIWW